MKLHLEWCTLLVGVGFLTRRSGRTEPQKPRGDRVFDEEQWRASSSQTSCFCFSRLSLFLPTHTSTHRENREKERERERGFEWLTANSLSSPTTIPPPRGKRKCRPTRWITFDNHRPLLTTATPAAVSAETANFQFSTRQKSLKQMAQPRLSSVHLCVCGYRQSDARGTRRWRTGGQTNSGYVRDRNFSADDLVCLLCAATQSPIWPKHTKVSRLLRRLAYIGVE